MSSQVSRRQAIGGALSCLILPSIPEIKLKRELERPIKTFYVEHCDHWGHVDPAICDGEMVKFYKADSVASEIIMHLYDDGVLYSSDKDRFSFDLLLFLWNNHDHEATDKIPWP